MALRSKLIADGFDRFSHYTTVAELRNNIWDKKKPAVMAKYDNSQKTGFNGAKWAEV
jgi:hypothetical protein